MKVPVFVVDIKMYTSIIRIDITSGMYHTTNEYARDEKLHFKVCIVQDCNVKEIQISSFPRKVNSHKQCVLMFYSFYCSLSVAAVNTINNIYMLNKNIYFIFRKQSYKQLKQNI